MKIKSLITTSVVALISASAAQAADVIIPRETAPAVITAPSFSWTGFYIGGQIGNLSSKAEMFDADGKNKRDKNLTPKLSGFMGGIYAGSNIDLGSGLILGVETDAVWADRDDSKVISATQIEDENGGVDKLKKFLNENKATYVGGHAIDNIIDGVKRNDSVALKEKWSGATRVRVGFTALDRIMPYVAGGVAYAQLQRTDTTKVTGSDEAEIAHAKTFNKSKTFVGFTIGGGVDFAMTDNVLLRAEYRYSDFGKKAFEKGADKTSYKTNDFRVGVAYKF
ncbi:outer membrane protein [Bartonella silvatica]